MNHIYIIHGWGDSPEGSWFPWLKQKLEKKGYTADILEMPNPDAPSIREWVSVLQHKIKPDPNTILVGHSVGCQTILRYLETLPTNTKIRAVICVAGWFTLNELETKEEKEVAHEWLTQAIDFKIIQPRVGDYYYIYSDNDPYVPLENKTLFEKNLGAKTYKLHDYGHIWKEDNVRELPEVLEIIEKL